MFGLCAKQGPRQGHGRSEESVLPILGQVLGLVIAAHLPSTAHKGLQYTPTGHWAHCQTH